MKITVLFCFFTSICFAGKYKWTILDTFTASKTKTLKNYQFEPLKEYIFENKHFSCTLMMLKDFSTNPKDYQESVAINCGLKTDKKVNIRDYAGCGERDASITSGGGVDLTYDDNSYVLRVSCSKI